MIRQDLSEIFEQCAEAIQYGEATLEECVARYPNVEGLRQMLQAVNSVRSLPQQPMRVASKRALERRLLSRLPQQPIRQARRLPFPITFASASAAILAVIVLLFVAATNRDAPLRVAAVPTATDHL